MDGDDLFPLLLAALLAIIGVVAHYESGHDIAASWLSGASIVLWLLLYVEATKGDP